MTGSPHAAPFPAAGTGAVSVSFIGRGMELKALRAALDRVHAGTDQLVMLAGDGGMGKTRLCEEVASEAEQRHIPTAWGRCFEEPGAPAYWPWIQAMRSRFDTLDDTRLHALLGEDAAAIAGIVPELRHRLGDLPPLGALEPDQQRFQLFHAVTGFWQRIAGEGALLLILENLHWADPSSLRLLGFFAAQRGAHRLMLLGTYRQTELTRPHALGESLAELARCPGYQHLRLNGFSREETAQFLQSASGESPAPEALATLHQRTEGHPLFLVETVRYLLVESRTGTSFKPDAAGALNAIPEGVRAIIGKRLNRLSPACTRLLSIAACIGRSFSTEQLVPLVAESSEEAVLAALEEAQSAHIIESQARPDQYQFSHALIRETLYDEMLPLRRARLHQQIGELIEAQHRDAIEPCLSPLAYHFGAALPQGSPARALEYIRRAADSAAALLAHEEAISLYQRGLDLQQRYLPEGHDIRCTLLLGLGDVQDAAGASEASRKTFLESAAVARTLGSAVALVRAAIGFETAGWRLGHPGTQAVVLLTEALATARAQEDDRAHVDLLASLCRAYAFTDRPAEATHAYREAAALARRLEDPVILFRALVAFQATRFFGPDQLDERLAAAREALALAGQHPQQAWAMTELYGWHFADLMEKGEIEAARTVAAAQVNVARVAHQPFMLAVGLSSQTLLAIHEGRFGEAEALAQETLKAGRRFSPENAAGAYGMQMFSIRREQGRLAEVLPVLRQFVAGQTESAIWRPGLAVLYLELGLRAQAQAEFDSLAAGDFAAIPRGALWPTSMAFLAEVCAYLEDAERAGTLYRLLSPYAGRNLSTGNNAPCFGAADRLLGMLAATREETADAQRHFEAALAMNGRTGGRPWLAHTQFCYAERLLRGRDHGTERAATLLDAARAIAQELGMAALEQRCARLMEQLDERLEYPDALSKREVDVLRLLAAGFSNHEIGARLFISTHTVANHIRSILAKTGSANRTEAAAYAVRRGLTPR
jgi:predicted ATPase/DNA-binding CsgD family transcriptional regulator